MYELAVAREFDAVHYLVGGDWGEENQPHSHHYKVEVILSGPNLDKFGYLVDITLIDQLMDELVHSFAGKTLNDLGEFEDLNPSIEHFSRIWCLALLKRLEMNLLTSIRVRIWENEIAWASYTEQVRCELDS
jgi:6-pyruvoyltetrahydropterin/6-carboxytetrahydropterin synthase